MRFKPETYLCIGILLFLVVAGAMARDPGQVRKFRAENACPATNLFTGACPGWVVDHAWPLCAGGKDDPSNMRWQEYKESLKKDILERMLCKCMAEHDGKVNGSK